MLAVWRACDEEAGPQRRTELMKALEINPRLLLVADRAGQVVDVILATTDGHRRPARRAWHSAAERDDPSRERGQHDALLVLGLRARGGGHHLGQDARRPGAQRSRKAIARRAPGPAARVRLTITVSGERARALAGQAIGEGRDIEEVITRLVEGDDS
jgi:hypothetical protein